MRLPGLLLWIGLLVYSACTDSGSPYTHMTGQAQGTTFNITYQDSLNRSFTESIDSIFRLLDQSMSLWQENSIISRININDSTAIPDEHFLFVFTQAQSISRSTQGALDITIGPLVNAWGFSRKNQTPIPDSTVIADILSYTGYEKVSLQGNQVVKADARIQLDFNAIAQGYTVDLICFFLESKGVRNYLVEVGGELRGRGHNERHEAWVVGIDKPVDTLAEGRPLQTSIQISDKALATSGNYRKFIEKDGQKYSHIIDPTTGLPANQNLLSVSVLADDCTTADGYATAFMVLGLEKAMVVAKENKLEIYAVYADENGQLKVAATPDFPEL